VGLGYNDRPVTISKIATYFFTVGVKSGKKRSMLFGSIMLTITYSSGW